MPPCPALARLLSPQSVAVIGGRTAESVALELAKAGYKGKVWPVNPKRETMADLPCFASVAELPEAPDAAYIAVASTATVAVVDALREMGTGGVIVHAAGFEEAGSDGANLSDALVAAAGDMPLVGPNCWGMLNMFDRAALWPDFHGLEPVQSGVAILSQSGNMSINFTMQTRALPLGMVISVGNQTVTDINDLLAALIEDDRVTAIGLHCEGIADVARFSELACQASAIGKPVIALKTGASEKGAQATVSHTATLSGADDLYTALFDRTGVARVHSVPAFLEALKLAHAGVRMPTGKCISLSCSGGEASLMADAVDRREHISLPDLSDQVTGAVQAVLGERVHVANPLDYHTFIWGDAPGMQATYAAMMREPADLHWLVIDLPRADRADPAQYDVALNAWIAAAGETGARCAVIATMAECLPEATSTRLREAGIVPLLGVDEALGALEALARVHKRAELTPIARPEESDGKSALVPERDAKLLLAGHGLAVPAGRVCPVGEAARAASDIGFPVVVKAVAENLAHKTEAGGVALNLSCASDVQSAAEAMATICDQVLVEQMVQSGVCELIVGVKRDPQFGLALVVGAGGILTELLKDSTTLLLPASRAQIEASVKHLRIWPLITGYRGRSGDERAVLDAIEAVAKFAQDNAGDLQELDINPLIVLENGAVAADALLRMRQP